MTNEELKLHITELLPNAVFEEGGEWLNIQVEPGSWPDAASLLRSHPQLNFDYLFCVTCIDWSATPTGKDQLSMVYHLSSTGHRNTLVCKIKLYRNEAYLSTVSHIWKTAVFHEREAYEMFGVHFLNHPDLRLLILPDGWEGRNPMRKDFEDPVNMIRL